MPDSPPALEGRYRIDETRVGGQSIVYKAVEVQLERTVAIRTPNEATRRDPRRLNRFVESARALARIQDENVLRVHHFFDRGELDESCYLVSEWMDTTLEEVLGRVRLDPRSGIAVLQKLLKGLRAIHLSGVLHRDLKPSNIFLSSDGREVRIGDLGGAEGTIGDAVKYRAPEAFEEEGAVDARSDLYALGLIAHELLLGRETFEAQFPEIHGADDERVRRQRWLNWHRDRSRTAPRLHAVSSAIRETVSDVVARMLTKNPDGRFPDADAALRALQAAAGDRSQDGSFAGPTPLPLPTEGSDGTGSGLSRVLGDLPRPWYYAIAGVLVLLAVVGTFVLRAARVSDDRRAAIEAGNAMKAAREAAIEAGANEAPPVEAFVTADREGKSGGQAFKRKDYSVALQHFTKSLPLYKEAVPQVLKRVALRAREGADAAREEAEGKGASSSELYRTTVGVFESAQDSLESEDFRKARKGFDEAREGFELAARQGGRPTGSDPVVFTAGSRPGEIDAALELCRRHQSNCDRSWYASETLREVALTPFNMDPYEVTNAQFARFVDSTGHVTDVEGGRGRVYRWDGNAAVETKGYTWRAPSGPGSSHESLPQHPVVNVTWNDAVAYCRWAGGRVPREEEWEALARGRDRRVYPWGNDWDGERTHWNGTKTREVGSIATGATASGLFDLAGSVWEWTSTVDASGHVLKGGSYQESNPANLRAAARRTDDSNSAYPDSGFRCVQDVGQWP